MRSLAPVMTIAWEGSALEALEQMAEADVDRLLVMDGDCLVGLLARSTIRRALHRGSGGDAQPAWRTGSRHSVAVLAGEAAGSSAGDVFGL